MNENVDLARSWIIGLYGLMRMSLQLLGTDQAAVTEAFNWLHGTPDDKDRRAGGRDRLTAELRG